MLLSKNKLSKQTFLIVFISYILIIVACEGTLDLRTLESSQMITLNSILIENEPIQVEITCSQNYPPGIDTTLTIKNAIVRLYEDEVFIENLYYKESYQRRYEYGNHLNLFRNYQSLDEFFPTKNHKYSILVSAPDFEEVFSSTIIPENVRIISVDTATIFTLIGQNLVKVLECSIKFSDPPDRKNYYLLKIFRRGLLYESPFVFDNPGTSIVNYSIPFLCNDLNVISYKYPVGTWGIREPGSESEENLLFNVFLSDDSFDGTNYIIKVLIDFGNLFDLAYPPIPGEEFTMRKIYLNLFSIDEAYFKYARSNYSQVYKRDDIFSEPCLVYNNIKNGVGIFAGASVSSDSSLYLPIFYQTIFK